MCIWYITAENIELPKQAEMSNQDSTRTDRALIMPAVRHGQMDDKLCEAAIAPLL